MKSRDPIVKAFQNNKGVRVQNDVRSNMPAMKKQVAQQQAKFNALPAAAKKAEVVKQVKIAGKFAAETALSATGVGVGKTIAKSVAKVVAKKAFESAAKDVAKKAVSAKYPTSNVKKINQSSSAKKNYYDKSTENRVYKTTYKESIDDIYQQQRGMEFGDESTIAHDEARAAVMEIGRHKGYNALVGYSNTYKNQVNKSPKSKAIRKQDAKRNEIIKNNKKKGK